MLTLQYQQGGGCGDDPQDAEARFTSSDTTIVSIDSLRGSLIGKRVGDAAVWLNYPGNIRSAGSNIGIVTVHVR